MNKDNQTGKLQIEVQVQEHTQEGWQFIFTQSGILTSKDLDMLTDLLVLQGIPDIVFGNNTGVLYNQKHNFAIFINPRDALYFTNFKHREASLLELKEKTTKINHISVNPQDVKLQFAESWKKTNQNPDIKQLERISDTFYSTPYKGSVVNSNQIKFALDKVQKIKELSGKSVLDGHIDQAQVKNDADYIKQVFEQESGSPLPYSEPTTEEIPLHNLTQANPILWAYQIPLYEDELGDNGHCQCEFRFRVMKDCFFGLIRSYLRVDGVILRIYDTRLYHDFKWNYVLREFTTRESTWDEAVKKGFVFTPSWATDQQQSFLVQNFLEVKSVVREKIYYQ